MVKSGVVGIVFVCASLVAFAQDSIPSNHFTFFPHPIGFKTFRQSIGFMITPVPQDIAEEGHLRAPAIDYHFLYSLPKGFHVDGRLNVQYVQNHVSLGLRWAHPLGGKVSFSVGDDFAHWFGTRTIDGLKTNGSGWMNYPNASVGFRISGDVLLTFKGEGIMTISSTTRVSGDVVSQQKSLFSGWAGSIMLEQPLYGKKGVSLGVRLINSNFYWQTWSIKGTFDRMVFYPEIIVGFIL